MAIASVEASTVFGIKKGDRYLSEPWRITEQDSAGLREAIQLPGSSPVPRIAPLALISATMASIAQLTDVRDAIRESTRASTGVDEAVAVYASQTAEFLQPVGLGDRLVCDATVLSARQEITKRGKTRVVNQLIFETLVRRGERSIITGRDIVTRGRAMVRMIVLKPESQLSGQEQTGVFANLNGVTEEVLRIDRGSERFVHKSPYFLVTKEAIGLFARSSKDNNDLHLKSEKARRTPFRGPIAHGMLPEELFLQYVEDLDPTNQITQVKMVFVGPVYPGDIIGSEVQHNGNDGTGVFPYKISKVTRGDHPGDLVEMPVIIGKITMGHVNC